MHRSSSAPAIAACRSVIALHEEGGLSSPRLEIAHEIEGDILDIAQKQVEASEKNTDATHKQLQIGIAAFLAGAALEDALRRLCDAQRYQLPTANIYIESTNRTLPTIEADRGDFGVRE